MNTLPSEVAVRDPLSQVTRNERRMLLLISTVGITIAKTGLVPSKISALGIEFGATDQKSLLGIFGLVTFYFLFTFITYAAADFVAWRLAFKNAMRQYLDDRISDGRGKSAEERRLYAIIASERKLAFMSGPISLARAVLEFVVPVVVAGYATFVLFNAPPPIMTPQR